MPGICFLYSRRRNPHAAQPKLDLERTGDAVAILRTDDVDRRIWRRGGFRERNSRHVDRERNKQISKRQGLRHGRLSLSVRTAATLILAAFTQAVIASPVEDGNAAYQRGDYGTAVKLLRPLVDQGNADAQDILAVMYYVGQGVPQSRTEAIRLYRLAAEQGNAHAQDALGFAYQNGVGVQRDVSEAAKWFRKSADQDNIDA
jgi:Sel1 repeat